MKRLVLIFCALSVVISLKAQVVINEICPANADIIHDPHFFNFSGWVELYNAGPTDVDLGGYYLSDDQNVPDKWQIPFNISIPSKGYLLIWCDKENTSIHTNFNLDSDGEQVILSNASGELVDKVDFPRQHTNISYGRTTDGGNSWNYLPKPTPQNQNISSTATDLLEKPTFSLKAGRYGAPISVTITHTHSGAVIRYTLDGSEPTESSAVYADPITIAKTSTLKAKAYHPQLLPSKAEVKTYFINEHDFTIPVVSLSTKPEYLTDNTIGIHVVGTNGIIGHGSDVPVNWNQPWWRHADFEFFAPSGEKQFDESLDMRISGNFSRRKAQKSFAFKPRDKYGSNTVKQKLFPNKNIERFGSFILRNSGTDWNISHFRDAFMQNLLVGELDVDYQDYQPTAVYLNGQYWGILNLREKVDKDYLENNFGVTEVDLLEGRQTALEGSNETYVVFMDSLYRRVSVSDPGNFKFIDRYIDVQEYINYNVANIYYANTDWPGNNITFWRPRIAGGKFRWILWDTDFGFQLYDHHTTATFPSLEYVTDATQTEGQNREWATRPFRTMIQNPVFRNRFIQTMLTSLQTTFEPQRVISVIDKFENTYKTEMAFHRAKWGGSMSLWFQNVQKMRTFAVARNAFMKEHMVEFFGLKDEISLSVKLSPLNAGTVSLNGVKSAKPLDNLLYFNTLPYLAQANPNDGYIFKHWNVSRRDYQFQNHIPAGSEWKYFDKGSLPASNWIAPDYDDSSWSSGAGQLGYGEGDEKTVVSYGPSSGNKYITTYFRKQFNIASLNDVENFSAGVVFDDGVVIYLNGLEIYRNNMPAGEITYSTLATRSISVENEFSSVLIDKSLLVEGINTLAVEVHQNVVTTSDLSFDFKLDVIQLGDMINYTTESLVIADTAYSNVVLEAMFEPVQAVSGIVINEFCPTKSNVMDEFDEEEDWIELYNTGSSAVDVGGLFITDNIQNKTKYRIPLGSPLTIIQPGEFLLLWADEDPDQGPKHLDFKLSAEGEAIGLYQAVGSELITLDEVSFAGLTENQSWSRIPNGIGPFLKSKILTPGAENQIHIDPVMGDEGIRESSVTLYPNPAKGSFKIKSNLNIPHLEISDLYGRTVKSFPNPDFESEFDVSDLPIGLYMVRIGNGTALRLILK